MDAEYGSSLIAEGLAVAEGLGLGEDAERDARIRRPRLRRESARLLLNRLLAE